MNGGQHTPSVGRLRDWDTGCTAPMSWHLDMNVAVIMHS